jgi:MOSC domain-containing protein YiiM
MFGENLTTEGLHESGVYIGDRYQVGTTELIVTQPRVPCYKLGIRFGRPEMIKRFLHSGRSGFYFAVAQEGEVKAGDSIEILSRQADSLSISDINKLYVSEKNDPEMLLRASRLGAMPESWRGYFLERLERTAG